MMKLLNLFLALAASNSVVALQVTWSYEDELYYRRAKDATDDNGRTRLHKEQDVFEALLLIDAGAKVNAKDLEGNTPLHCAAQSANVEVYKALIDWGADDTIKNNHHQTPVELAKEYFLMAVYKTQDKKEARHCTPKQKLPTLSDYVAARRKKQLEAEEAEDEESKQQQHFSENRLCLWTTQLLLGLHEIQAHNLVQSPIQLENIFANKEKNVQILCNGAAIDNSDAGTQPKCPVLALGRVLHELAWLTPEAENGLPIYYNNPILTKVYRKMFEEDNAKRGTPLELLTMLKDVKYIQQTKGQKFDLVAMIDRVEKAEKAVAEEDFQVFVDDEIANAKKHYRFKLTACRFSPFISHPTEKDVCVRVRFGAIRAWAQKHHKESWSEHLKGLNHRGWFSWFNRREKTIQEKRLPCLRKFFNSLKLSAADLKQIGFRNT